MSYRARTRTNLRRSTIRGGSNSRVTMTSSDMTHRGMWTTTDADTIFSNGTFCFVRVNPSTGQPGATGDLRIWYLGTAGVTGTSSEGAWDWSPGNLLEFSLPSTYGSDASTANELTKVRELGNGELWASGYYRSLNGVVIGGMWYDDEWDVLWYTYYSVYAGIDDPPFLGATRFAADGTYTKFGPWKFPTGGTIAQSYRLASWWIQKAPASVKAIAPNAEMLIGGCVGSTAVDGNRGPGMYWFKRPTLTAYQSGVTYTLSGAIGTALLRLGNTSSDWGPVQCYNAVHFDGLGDSKGGACRRPNDYDIIGTEDGLLQNPSGSDGYWIASLDNVCAHFFVEGAAKYGLFGFGRRVAPGRHVAYTNDNPHTVASVEYFCNHYGSGNNYRAFVTYPTQYTSTSNSPSLEPALYWFDPVKALEVTARSGRGSWDVPVESIQNWNTLWGLPIPPDSALGTYPTGGTYPVIHSPQGQPSSGAYDPTTQRLIWCQARTKFNGPFDPHPLFQVFDLGVD